MINSGNAGLFVWSEKEDVDTVPEDAITSKMSEWQCKTVIMSYVMC